MLSDGEEPGRVWDLAIVGSGPCGVAALWEAHKHGLSAVALERGRVCDSIKRYPPETVFHTTAPFLEVEGEIPDTLDGEHVDPAQVARHFVGLAQRCPLPVLEGSPVERLERSDGGFELRGSSLNVRARSVLLATGHYDAPRRLGVPGELGGGVKVRLDQSGLYAGRDVVVVGGSASALEAAELLRKSGAKVVLVHRGDELGAGLQSDRKAPVLAAVEKGQIRLELNTRVERFEEGRCFLEKAGTHFKLPFDSAFVLIGFSASDVLARNAGATYAADGTARIRISDGYTGIPGLYLVGAACNGERKANRIGMKSGIPQARRAVADIAEFLKGRGK